jgi:hypothetical protein
MLIAGRVWRFLAPALLALATVGLFAPPLSAQSDEERAGARAAATEGAKAFRERRFPEAIDLFTRAESLVHAPPHLLYLGRSQAELGMLVQARENLLKVARESLPGNAPKAFHDAQDDAKEELQKLEARLPYVTINVDGGGAARVAVTEDGRRIPDALVGVPRPVNPGKHQYEGVAEGLRGTAAVELKEGERQNVVLKLEPAAGVAAPAAGGAGEAAGQPGAPGQPGGEGAAGGPSPDVQGGRGMSGLRIASFPVMGLGVVGIVVGAVFASKAGSTQDEGDGIYDENGCAVVPRPLECTPEVQSEVEALWNDASSQRTTATVFFVAGGALVVGGAVMFIVGGNTGKSSTPTAHMAPRVRPWVGLGQAGLTGTF